MDQDFSPPNQGQFKKKKGIGTRLIVFLVLLAVAAGIFLFDDKAQVPETQAYAPPVEMSVPPAEVRPERRVDRGEVRPGETITSLLGDYFSPLEIHQLAKKSRSVFPLSRICAGQPYRICTEGDSFESFYYEIDSEQELLIRKGENGIDVSRVDIPYTVEEALVRGTIRSSLFEAVEDTGEGPEIAFALADIFAWDIDFLRDLRKGDTFQALVQKRYREGKPAGYGRILAAEFTNRGKSYRAIRYADGDLPASYYDPKGTNLRKAFLRAPLSYSRISSGFTMKRFHPITKTWKAHPAIDYAAPRGTPIMTVGDGVITKIGYTRGNGNYIKVRHNNSYETLYLHMTRFTKGMKKGKRIAQGQRIGYVGSTGLATGPHLCFRMYKNGKPVNPYKVKTPSAKPVSKELLARFLEAARPLMASLEGRSQEAALATRVAKAEKP